MKKSKKAAGIEGFLLLYPNPDNMHENIVRFRVYDQDGEGNIAKDKDGNLKFKDYRILHQDLKIKLLDGVIFESESDRYIGYKGN